MHTVKRSVLLPYSCEQMFDLVAEVEKYPEFMPWCGGATVNQRDEKGMEASVTISIAGIRQTFTTRNEHDYPNRIVLRLVKGPFSALTGDWQFTPLGEKPRGTTPEGMGPPGVVNCAGLVSPAKWMSISQRPHARHKCKAE